MLMSPRAINIIVSQAAADVLGELEEAKEGRAASEAEVRHLHSQLLRLEETAEADLARAADEVHCSTCPLSWLLLTGLAVSS